MRRRTAFALAWLAAAIAALPAPLFAPRPAAAQEVLEKRVFEAGRYQTRGGATLPNVRIGYQTMGRLNEAGDNAVLITHFFSGNSHAFGRLAAGGPPGWWDAIIGPGKPIDTDRFFVVAADTLVNVNVPDPNTVTTGPATLNPDTGRPWGMTFPVVAMRDFVEVQKRLLDSPRRPAAGAGGRPLEWRAAGDRVRRSPPRLRRARDAGDRRRHRCLDAGLARHLGGADPARPRTGARATTTPRGGSRRCVAWPRPGRS
jgi:hypothetical protein